MLGVCCCLTPEKFCSFFCIVQMLAFTEIHLLICLSAFGVSDSGMGLMSLKLCIIHFHCWGLMLDKLFCMLTYFVSNCERQSFLTLWFYWWFCGRKRWRYRILSLNPVGFNTRLALLCVDS